MEQKTLGKFGEIDGCDRLLILMAQAISAWITIQRCCSRRSSVYEHSLYLPIIEVGKSQQWQVTHEKLIKKSPRLSGRKIDFVFERGSEIAALEVKYMGDIDCAPKSYFSGKAYVPKDIENAAYFYEEKRKITQTGYVMICGYKK